jgi:hypothetical protein
MCKRCGKRQPRNDNRYCGKCKLKLAWRSPYKERGVEAKALFHH